MFLFILESIGTSELLLIGLVALIFLGPRKLPQIAKTIGKTLNEFRNTTNEFKATWEREVNFEEEARAIRTGELADTPVARMTPIGDVSAPPAVPEVKSLDKSEFDSLTAIHGMSETENVPESPSGNGGGELLSENPLADKRSWL